MSERTTQQKVRIAVIGLVGITVSVGLAMNIQRLPLIGAGDTYYAEFTDAAGLVSGEEVRVAGIKVGTVTDIELGRGKVKVAFTVKGTDLGNRTRASIEIKTLLGQHYLALDPAGSRSLDGGDTIPLARTVTPLNVVPAFQRLTTDLQETDTAQLASAFDVLAETLQTTAPQVKGALQGLSRLSTSISSRDEQIRDLFRRAEQVSGSVARRDEDITALLRDTSAVLEMLAQRREVLVQIISGTKDLATELTGLVQDNRQQLGPVLADLNVVLGVLEENRANLDDSLRYAAQYASEFVSVGGTGRFLETTIKLPRAFQLCQSDRTSSPLGPLLAGVLTKMSANTSGAGRPCLPITPTADINSANGGGQ